MVPVRIVVFRGALFIASAFAVIACSGSSGSSSSGDTGTSGTFSSGSSGTTSTSGGTSGMSSSGSSGTTSGGTSGMSSSGSSGMTSGGTDPVAACISACEAMYPQGAQIGKGIDTCWAAKCPSQCNGIGTGQSKPPANGNCKNDVRTPSSACSQCTVDKCCTAWDACFDNAQCSALNECSIACYK